MLVVVLAFAVAAQEAPEPAPPPAAPAASADGAEAPAAPVVDDPTLADDPAFADGVRYYDKLEFEKAAFRFRQATRATDRAPAVIARAYLWLGLALAQADDELSAREAFVAARRLDESSRLPADAPPSVRTIFEEARSLPAAEVETRADEPDAAAEPLPLSVVVGGSIAAGGALAFVAGGVTGALALAQADAAEKERFQDDALAVHEGAEAMALVATGLLVTGAAAAIAGAAVVVGGALLE